jgi:uncharacterized membrane protein YqgA involved in biofilm formation
LGGAILNTITVALGSLLGLALGNRFPHRIQTSIVAGLGLITLVVGFSNAQRSGNLIIPLLALIIGIVVGETLNLEKWLERFADWLRRVTSRGKTEGDEARARFINGFITASLVFCIGPLTFVGSIQDGMGLSAGFQQIAIKSMLDFFAAMAFAAAFGPGVFFTTITVLVLQGGLSLLGMALGDVMTPAMIAEMTAVGGLILIGLGLSILEIKRLRVVNFLPALVIAPLLVALAAALGITIYPF